MSKIMKWMRHLRSASSTSRSTATPEAIATPSEPLPRAFHESQWSSSIPKNLMRPIPEQLVMVLVFSAPGTTDASGLVRLLERETHWGEWDMMLGRQEDAARFICNGYIYSLQVFAAAMVKDYTSLYNNTSMQWRHVSLVFTYDAGSRASWDEAAATHDDIRSRCENWSVPVTTLLLGMGASGEEAAALAKPRACLTAGYSPTSGKGVCSAFASLVEQACAAGSKFPSGILPAADMSDLPRVLFNPVPTDE